MWNFRLKQTSHRTWSGGCNEPWTAAWEREWTRTLHAVGFESGASNPLLLRREKLDASMAVHGDELKTLGDDDALGEVYQVGRIADPTLSQCGDEGSVFVARQTRSVVLSNGAGERHAENERTIDDQSEAR